MLCPYCQNRLLPGAPECRSCRLTFPRTSALLGATPRLSQTLADLVHILKPAEEARIRKRISQIRWRFPQLTLQIVLIECPPPHPLRLHTFWLFNAGAFASEFRRGKNNHAVLLVIDPARSEAALMPGYGLEEILRPEAMDQLLEVGGSDFREMRWADGILSILNGLDQLFEFEAIPANSPSKLAADF